MRLAFDNANGNTIQVKSLQSAICVLPATFLTCGLRFTDKLGHARSSVQCETHQATNITTPMSAAIHRYSNVKKSIIQKNVVTRKLGSQCSYMYFPRKPEWAFNIVYIISVQKFQHADWLRARQFIKVTKSESNCSLISGLI